MASDRLRVAVIGVGHLGRHHARILSGLDDVALVAVVDRDQARARHIAAAAGTLALTDPARLPPVDAVVVATPTDVHGEAALPLLARGVSVLVEKPITPSLEEADALIHAAARSGAVLAVGHSERFNPALLAALPHITTPGFVEIHRLGSFPDRSLDIDVVFDLMIHDLDVLLSTVGTEVTSIEAVGVPVLTPKVDIANVRLRFASGCIANLTASRISRERVRKVRFFQPQAYLSIDYASREVEWYRLEMGSGAPAIAGGKVEVAEDEPLALELRDFVDAVRERRAPRVSGADGRRALELAHRITAVMEAAGGGQGAPAGPR